MNRTIKFRFWKTETKEWVNFPSRTGIYSHQPIIDPVYTESNYFIIQQFTGLLDKNGKEIYEGDILKAFDVSCFESKSPLILYVAYEADNAWFVFKNSSDALGEGYYWQELSDVEIVGNIFENGDLLK